jgi:hypothetical protein
MPSASLNFSSSSDHGSPANVQADDPEFGQLQLDPGARVAAPFGIHRSSHWPEVVKGTSPASQLVFAANQASQGEYPCRSTTFSRSIIV